QVHAPGAALSYCNAGYNIAGRVVEILRGVTWEAAIRDHIVAPLDLHTTATLPEDAILHRVAIGHRADPDGEPIQTTTWSVPRSSGPSAAVATTANDLLTFAAQFLGGSDGRMLSPQSVRAMTTDGIPVPLPGMGITSWGLGWFHSNWDGHPVIGHDGTSSGQRAYVRLFPTTISQ
ncbi:serine hydrolase domain-containing protein, partial [Deinococcus caeni]|uniref:serine hydrolase domain-containing protein n=1 Tax=Deinococcus caeni TaxID=569127 RepID=UPI0036160CE5